MMYFAHVALRALALTVAASAMLPTPSAAQAAHSTPAAAVRSSGFFPSTDSLLARMKPLVESGRTKGLVIGVLEADGSTRVLSLGAAGPDRVMNDSAQFELGSVVKTMTATILADMVTKGEVSLNDPVSKYLPVQTPSRGGRAITLLDLATHFSGLPRMAGYDAPDDLNPYAAYTVQNMYAYLPTIVLEREPGASFEYSNFGYGVLAHALARAAGTTYENLVRTRILEPLELSSTWYGGTAPMSARMTSGHDTAGKVVPHWTVTEAHMGAGGMVSTAADMLTYLAANIGAPRNELERAMRETHAVRRNTGERDMGLAWMHRKVDGRTIIWHGGDTGGYHSFIGFDPVKQVGLVLLSNSDSQDSQLLLFAMSLLIPPATDTTLRDVPLKAEDAARYEGTYSYVSSGAARELRIYTENGVVKAQMIGGPLLALRYQGDHTFAATVGPTTIRIVFSVKDGRADRFVIHQRGQELPGVRKQ